MNDRFPTPLHPSRLTRLRLEHLEDRLAPALSALGAGPGGQPLVTVIDANGAVVRTFLAYDAAFAGGVNVALGDVTGDGVADIVTAAGPGGAPHVKVFDGTTFAQVRSFFAYDPAFAGGVTIATTDANGDGAADIVTGAGAGGGPHVKVFDGRTPAVLQSFYAYGPAFRGGVSVAVGDLNGDLLPDIITAAGPGGGPHVRGFDARTGTAVGSFYAYAAGFTGGVHLASADVDGNGTTELITGAGAGGGPHVRVWAAGPNPTLFGEFLASGGPGGGVRVGSVPGEAGVPDRIVAARPGGAGPLEFYDGTGRLLGTSDPAAGAGVSVASSVPQPDLLIRYHTLSQVAPGGGAGRLDRVVGDQYRLTVKGLTADTRVPWFADAPGRGTGQHTLGDFITRVWPRQYGPQGANAVLESLVGTTLYGHLFHLSNPRLDPAAGTLTFDARSLGLGEGPAGPLAIDRLILGLSPSDLTNAGTPIPAANHGAVRSFAVAAVGGTLAGTGATGTLTLEQPFDTTAQFTGVPTGDRFLEPVADFVARFTRRFAGRTPNAAVVYQDEQGALRTVTLNLTSARRENGNVVFDAAFTGPPASGRLGLPLLFVDNQGVPATDQMPTPTKDNLIDVLYTSDAVVNTNKLLTLRNNGPRTVYPFLRGVNDGYYQGNVGANWAYDSQPQDPHNQEYRGYVGYYDATNKQSYFGLQPGATITINVPLVFWDGARIGVATDTTYFTNALKVGDVNINNPFQYYQFESDGTTQTRRYIDQDPTRVGGTNGGPGNKPVVMYYHSGVAKAPAPEAADQLLEYTIRDPIQYQLNPNLPDPAANGNYLGPLFNYDISFVDSIMFPVALEAPDVPTGSNQPFGWIGAPQGFDEFQQALRDFTSGDPAVNGLGQYFNGGGWNKFFIPDEAATGVKLPATKNIIDLSPLNRGQSAYFTGPNAAVAHHTMASGGIRYQQDTQTTGTINQNEFVIQNVSPAVIQTLAKGMLTNNPGFFTPGTAIADLGATSITLNAPAANTWPAGQSVTFVGSQFAGVPGTRNGATVTLADRSLLATLKVGMLVTADGPGVAAGTRVLSIDQSQGTVTLTPGQTGSAQQNFTFSGGISDYVAERIVGLWYGWADYYVTHVTGLNPFVGQAPGGTTTATGRTITFATTPDLARLQPGMIVTGPAGVVSPGTVISRITTANNTTTVVLSKVTAAAQNATFTFALPKAVNRSPDVTPLVLDFSAASQADQDKANQFAQILYLVMDAFSTIPKQTDNSTSLELMQNIVGGNVTQITDIGSPGTPIWFELTTEYRDESKSLERSVYNFIAVPESSGEWYPEPSVPTAGAKVNGQPAAFNLYSLDPYVWFVHRKLGVSGYAFSLDDDAADVGATGSTSLKVTIGGLTGLPNNAEWFVGAPYGPVNGTGTAVKTPGTDPKTNPDMITGLPAGVRAKLVNPNIADGVYGAYVLGPGVLPGTRVSAFFLADAVQLDTKLGDIGTQPATYSFFGPVHATGTIDPKNNPSTITNIDPDSIDVLNRISVGGTLIPGSLVVIGPGVQQAPVVTRVKAIDPTGRTITLDQTLDPNQPAGTYRFKFT